MSKQNIGKVKIDERTQRIADRLDPEVENAIIEELEQSSVPLKGSVIKEAWIKGRHVSVKLVPDKSEEIVSRPFRVAFIDIETAPNLGYTWGKYDQNVIAFKSEWFILAFGFKWQDDEAPTTLILPDYSGYDEDRDNDRQLVARLWTILDEADLIIAHNGDKFDIKKINARFLQHGMTPPSPYKTVDTLKLARRYFALTSNKLDDIAKVLGVGEKAETGGFKLWLECMAGNREAWEKMRTYCGNDIVILEAVYEKLRPWHATHPSTELGLCDACGSDHLQRRGVGFNNGKKVQRLQCFDCGKWSRKKIDA